MKKYKNIKKIRINNPNKSVTGYSVPEKLLMKKFCPKENV